MNGAPIGFGHTDRNKDRVIGADEWTKTLRDIDKFRAGYETHGLLAIPINSKGVLEPQDYRTLETQGIPAVGKLLAESRLKMIHQNRAAESGPQIIKNFGSENHLLQRAIVSARRARARDGRQ